MKKLVALVSAVAILSSVASAEILKNFKYDGSLEVNAYNVNNADFDKTSDDKVGDVDTRLMLNMSFDLNEDANGVVTLVKNNRQWGTGSENLNTIQQKLFFEQAYLNLKGIIGIDHKLGRQFYGNPNDLVIYYGPKMWPYPIQFPVDALDAWVGTYKYNDWTFTGLLGKVAGATGDMGKNISGLDVKTKINRFNLNAYYYYRVNNSISSVSDKLGLLGARANWECYFVPALNLGLEYDQNTGKYIKKYKGYAYKINADYSMNLAGKLGFNAEYTYLSGQDSSSDIKVYTPINMDYRPGIIANGFGINSTYTGAIGTGAKIVNLGTNWTPEKLNKLNIAFNYYNNKVAKKKTGMKDTIGNEYDLVATWNHSDKVSIKGYYAMFKPEKDNVVNSRYGTKDDIETALGAAFVVKF